MKGVTGFATKVRAAAIVAAALACGVGFTSGSAQAAVPPFQHVGQFGGNGWKSDDTRNAAGTNLVGVNNTHAGKPGQVPTFADDAAIANQIKFVDGPAGSTFGGAVSIDGTSGNSGKSNFSVISPVNGFAAASDLLTTFNATYEWYGQPNPTSRTLAFKLGVQSTAYGTGPGQSQNGFSATRSGESVWDLVLVHIPTASNNAWSTVNVDHDTGGWNLFRQAGNAFFPVAPANLPDPNAPTKTLDDWAADPTYGALLFGPGAKVSSIQFGFGSGQRDSIAYVDYLQTSLIDGGNSIVNFVPEPASLGLLALGGTVLVRRRRR